MASYSDDPSADYRKFTRSPALHTLIQWQTEQQGGSNRSLVMLHTMPILADYVYIGGGLLGTILVVLLILFLLKKI